MLLKDRNFLGNSLFKTFYLIKITSNNFGKNLKILPEVDAESRQRSEKSHSFILKLKQILVMKKANAVQKKFHKKWNNLHIKEIFLHVAWGVGGIVFTQIETGFKRRKDLCPGEIH